MPVRTTVVGSWWLHPEMEQDLARHHAGECSPQESETILNRAAAKAIQEQRDLGLDEWTGGEYHTDNFILHMHKCLTGLEVDKPQADDVFDYDDMTHAKIVGKITAPHGLGYLEAFRREKKLPGGVSKAAVVAPYEVVVAGRDNLDAHNAANARDNRNRQSGAARDGGRRLRERAARCADFRRRGQYGNDDRATGGRPDRAVL